MENNSTLERLLRIQGNPKQITFEAVEGNRAPDPVPPPEAKNPQCEPARTVGQPRGKIYPAEREAWSSLYRIYEKYAPQLREAALLEDENEKAVKVFSAAAAEINELYQERGIIGKALAMPLYDLLGLVFKEAKAQAF